MSLRLTTPMLESAYEFLRTTLPFRRWKLPSGSRVKFRVTRHPHKSGECVEQDDGKTAINISGACVGHADTLLLIMAHEMVHLHLFAHGVRALHGSDFKRCAKIICRHHGFDEKQFL